MFHDERRHAPRNCASDFAQTGGLCADVACFSDRLVGTDFSKESVRAEVSKCSRPPADTALNEEGCYLCVRRHKTICPPRPDRGRGEADCDIVVALVPAHPLPRAGEGAQPWHLSAR